MTLVARAALARLVVAGTALACVTLLVAGCGSAAGSSASSAGSTPAVSPPGSAPTGSSSSPAGAPTPAPAGTLAAPPAYGLTDTSFPPCPTASVKVTLGPSQAAGGTTLQVIDFTNTGSQFCVLGGTPGASLAGGTPLAQIGLAAAVPTSGSVYAVPLNPGQVANSLLEIGHASNYSRATCDPVHAPYLVIAVPNTIGFVKLAYSVTACAKPVEILSISPISRGTGS